MISFPPSGDARDAQAWTAFAAEDAAVRPPAALEARVLRAAQRAIAERQRAEIDRRRRAWLATCAAVAACTVAAAGWFLGPPATPEPREAAAAPTVVAAPAASAEPAAKGSGRRVPMTNVEAGRVLGPLPPPTLASRPLFDAAQETVHAPLAPHSQSFGAEPIGHATAGARIADAVASTPALESAPGSPLPLASAPATTALSSRGFRGVFDRSRPEPVEGDPGYRLELATPAPVAPPPK